MNLYPEHLIMDKTLGEFATDLRIHLRTCPEDHSAYAKQVPLVGYNPAFDSLICNVCDTMVHLDVPAAFGGSLDIFICRLLKQQEQFYNGHFASCLPPEAQS